MSPCAITGELPPLESIPGWDSLSGEKQERLKEHTKNVLDSERRRLIQNGIQVFPTQKRQ